MTDQADYAKIVTIPPGQMAIPQKSYADRLIDVLDRALHDPSIPMDRIERTIALVKDARAERARDEWAADYAQLQRVLPTFEERGAIDLGKGGKKQTYALWADMNRILRPLLAEHGFGLTHDGNTTEKSVTVHTVLLHRGGHFRETQMTLPLDMSGSKNIVQAFGSSKSYAKRYNTLDLLNLSSSVEGDDDGRAAGGQETITDEQLKELQDLIVKVGADIKALCAYFEAPELAKIRAADYPRVIAMLNKKAAQAKEANPAGKVANGGTKNR